MRGRRVMAMLAATAAFAAVGCGGDDEEEPSGAADTPAATETPTEEAGATADAAHGKELFTQTCGTCHTLADAGTSGAVGPNLDDLAPDKERVLNAIATGPSQMPENLYEGQDAQDVAEYVSSAAGS
jgi:mono/diheme cytochrome c family protein